MCEKLAEALPLPPCKQVLKLKLHLKQPSLSAVIVRWICTIFRFFSFWAPELKDFIWSPQWLLSVNFSTFYKKNRICVKRKHHSVPENLDVCQELSGAIERVSVDKVKYSLKLNKKPKHPRYISSIWLRFDEFSRSIIFSATADQFATFQMYRIPLNWLILSCSWN